MKVTFLEPTIVPGIGVAQAGETRDVDVPEATLEDWKRRGIADVEEVVARKKDGANAKVLGALEERVIELNSKIEELTEKALQDADVRSDLESKLDSANAALTLAGDPEKLKAVVERNDQLADCLETFIPDERSGLNRFKETHLVALAVFVGVEGELPTKKDALADAVWKAIEARKS